MLHEFILINEDEYRFEINTNVSDILNHGEVSGTLVNFKVPWELSRPMAKAAS